MAWGCHIEIENKDRTDWLKVFSKSTWAQLIEADADIYIVGRAFEEAKDAGDAYRIGQQLTASMSGAMLLYLGRPPAKVLGPALFGDDGKRSLTLMAEGLIEVRRRELTDEGVANVVRALEIAAVNQSAMHALINFVPPIDWGSIYKVIDCLGVLSGGKDNIAKATQEDERLIKLIGQTANIPHRHPPVKHPAPDKPIAAADAFVIIRRMLIKLLSQQQDPAQKREPGG